MFGKESGVLAKMPSMCSHQYCSNGTIEVEVTGLINAGVEVAYFIFADDTFDSAKWAAESTTLGQHD